MRSIFFSSHFHLEVIKFFSVTPSAYQRPSSMLKWGVTIQCYFRALHSTLMLECTCTIHLGIQWPRIRCSRSYVQHQHGRLQGLCPTHPIIFSCVPELLAQRKSSIIQVLQSSSLNIKHLINYVLWVHAQHMKFYIYIYNI